ncbi:MAG: ABC transporter ATP-binding protein [Eggerthellaceae bacterium]|nr:ABC transporter ATP-binding protein [Eggerthellaceae bacterium]
MHKLVFSHISMDYVSAEKETTAALSDVSFELKDKESVAIIGPSGCGKSTLLRLAAGLQKPTSGEITVDGAALDKPRIKTALILQDFGLLPWKSVYHNAELGLVIRKVPKEIRKQKTMEALSLVGLDKFANRYPRELSGGMQQRLAIARVLTLDVDLLLMDEPLSALDALLRDELQISLLRTWKTGSYAQVLVTHSIEEAVFLGQRIVVMGKNPGTILAQTDNPGMGDEDYRLSEEYFEKVKEVRTALSDVMRVRDISEGDAL